MTLYEFLTLSEDEQFNTVWSKGVFVEQHIENEIAINLYSINNFFVEVYYDRKANKIIDKKTFKQGILLDKYLKNINL